LIVALAPIADLVEREPADARPARGRQVTFEVAGAQGGRNGGRGAVIRATADLAPGTAVRVTVGGTNGYNGGGAPGPSRNVTPGPGGGASDLRIGGTNPNHRVLVAAGGGGRGGQYVQNRPAGSGGNAAATGNGGNGGNGTGNRRGYGGYGGTSRTGGQGGGTSWCRSGPCVGSNGALGAGGRGGTSTYSGGGGGGGGFYGGGGGGAGFRYQTIDGAGGGGGGSSYVNPSLFLSGPSVARSGVRSGNGQVRISLDGGATWVATYEYSRSARTYTVPWPATVDRLDVTTGPVAGGTSVTLTGQHLSDVTAVSFCGTAGGSLAVVSDTTVTVETPAGSVGGCDVVLQTNANGSTSLPDAFRYYAVPAVATASPAAGPLGGGSIELTGSGFSGTDKVTIGGQKAAFSVNSDTSITATAPPAAAGEAAIAVTTKDASGTGPATFTYTEAPAITSVTPSVGPIAGGTNVTITGTSFGPATAVVFGATPAASFTVDSGTQITATSPALGVGASDVTVTTPGGTAVSAGAFHSYPTPDVTAISSAAGPTAGGDTVVLTGTNLAGVDVVNFGATAATSFTVDSDTEITAVTPAGTAGTVPVGIGNPGAVGTSAVDYTFVEAPTVITVDPVTIESDTSSTVTLTGTHLTGATSVRFGGTDAASFTVDSDTQITAATPSLAVGDHEAEITTAGGTATATVTALTTPTVTSLSPAAGPAVGGTTVTVVGTGLTGTSGVTFDGADAASFTTDSDTQLTIVTPPGDAGVAEIVIENTLHTSQPKVFTFTEPLAVKIVDGGTDVRPGSMVEISGSGFAPNTKIDIRLFSAPRHLGTVSSDDVGRFAASVEIPADTEAGSHLLVATGIDPFGKVQSVSLDVEVLAVRQSAIKAEPTSSSAEPVPSSLAATGRAFGIAARGGLIMLILGALMVSAGRRRSTVRASDR
jgi:hypothetical protein